MEHALEIIGTLVGLLYLWLEYRASIYLWIAGIIMPAVYIFVYYDAGLYADFGINIYYLGAAIYGWMMWKYGTFLRRKILRQKAPVQQVEYPGFRAIDEREVQGTITVPAAQLDALFAMPPYYWKTPRDGAARLGALPQLPTTIAFLFLVFEKL